MSLSMVIKISETGYQSDKRLKTMSLSMVIKISETG
jgi:hypothetical protein